MSASPALFRLPAPRVVNVETWIPYNDALRLCRRTAQWLSQQIREQRIVIRATADLLANGRPGREVRLQSLPADAQARYAQEQAALSVAEPQPSLFAAPQLVQPAPRIRVTAKSMPEAQRKHAILQPLLAMRTDEGKRQYAGLCLANGTPVNSVNRMIEFQIELYRSRGVELNPRTLKRWIAKHLESGVAGLARQKRKDSGRSRWFEAAEHQPAACLVAALHLGDGFFPGITVQACYDTLVAERELCGLPLAELPSYNTVRTFLAQLPRSLTVFARRGRKEFGERMLPYLSRAYQEPSNAIWVSDTAIMDVEVRNDCIPGAPKDAPIRLRLHAIIDYRSRYLVGYAFAWESSSAGITTALRHAVRDHGPCRLFYVDNGKDYCKVAKGAVPGYMQPGSMEPADWWRQEMLSIEQTGVLARLGIQVTHCIAHHPQSKHVERFFRTMHLTFCALWPTYTGGKPSERPDNTTALMTQHRRALTHGDMRLSHHPMASELMARFAVWVERYNHKRGHRGRGMGLASPAEVFQVYRDPQQRPAPDAADLARLLLDHRTAKVTECQVRVNNVFYAAAPGDTWTARLLFERNETVVSVAYDPLDPAQIAVLDDAGRLLTTLQPKQLVRMAPDDAATQATIGAMARDRALLTRGAKEQHLAIVRGARQLGVRQPLELLAPPLASNTAPDDAPSRIVPRKPRLTSLPETTAAPATPAQAAAALFARQQKDRP